MNAAREARVAANGSMRLPMLRCDLKKDVLVQVSPSCPKCVSLEKSLSEGMVGELKDFSFSDSEMETQVKISCHLHNELGPSVHFNIIITNFFIVYYMRLRFF